MRTAPVNHSEGPFTDGCEPVRLMCIFDSISPVRRPVFPMALLEGFWAIRVRLSVFRAGARPARGSRETISESPTADAGGLRSREPHRVWLVLRASSIGERTQTAPSVQILSGRRQRGRDRSG